MADETTDVSAQFQLSIIFRYLLSDGTPVERFWGFFNPTGHDAKSLSECIIFNLEKFLVAKYVDLSELRRRERDEWTAQ